MFTLEKDVFLVVEALQVCWVVGFWFFFFFLEYGVIEWARMMVRNVDGFGDLKDLRGVPERKKKDLVSRGKVEES